MCSIYSGKVILHSDLYGVPLLILANKQDRFVSILLLIYTCSSNVGMERGTNGMQI